MAPVLAPVPFTGIERAFLIFVIKAETTLVSEPSHAPTGIRTPVLALKGLRPGPLDDEGAYLSECNSTIHS